MTRGMKTAAAASGSFCALVTLILVLLANQVITMQLALLIAVALVGLYFGFGVLIWIYRLVARLG